jgi:vacuolar protein sorting-associated protein 13D
MNKPLHLPSINELHEMKFNHQQVIFYDNIQRELVVDITIVCVIKHRLKISVSVPYVLLNKSGIPLIFKDANSKIESAGQSPDDESTLNQEPLLFSFENSNRNNSCAMRVGNGLHSLQDGRPQWSQRFSLEHGSTHRQLQVRSSRNSSDWNYSIGIDIRPGNGHLKKINFIFLSARYMIYNQCSYNLLISQRELINDNSNYLRISKHTTVTYHWPKTDIEQLLCVKVIDELVNWSGSFPIDCINAFHINMRYENGQCLILRVQIIERNSTYFVVFMDSDQMPAPFRISNRSDIPIEFYQTDIREELTYLRTIIKPQQSMDYAWDEPSSKSTLTCSIVDGNKVVYDLLKLGPADDLLYQNYIYLAFEDTPSHQLVIEFIDNHLLLSKKQNNKRSQLWNMTYNGLLIHVGSPSLSDSMKKKEQSDDLRQTFVLDIEDSGENDLSKLTTRFTRLTVRRYDPKRSFTQTWQFLDNGYLCLANTKLCVQVFGELIENSDLVLGPIT